MLRRALPYTPPGVHVAVVDPEVGAQRRAIALRVADEDRILVGPDNGVLWLAAQRFGGAVEVVDIGRSAYRLEDPAATFHGRDIFSPVAAHLASGVALGGVGEPIDADSIDAAAHAARAGRGGRDRRPRDRADRFGNVMLDVEHAELSATGVLLGPSGDDQRPRGRLRDDLRRRRGRRADPLPGRLQDGRRSRSTAARRWQELGLERDSEVRISAR